MMLVFALERFHVQTHPPARRKGLKELFEQFGVHVAHLVALELDIPDEIGATAKVECRTAQSFIHRQIGMPKPRYPAKITKRFSDGFTKHNAGVFDRVVHIDMQVAFQNVLRQH